MKKRILTLLFIVVCFLLKAQLKYDTISFDEIILNNHILYTKFNFFKKNINDKETNAKVYTGKDINIPFRTFANSDILYTVFSKKITFSYEENTPQDIFITYVNPNKYIKLKLKIDSKTVLCLDKKMDILILKKHFKNSYSTFIKTKKDFRLVVKNGNQYAYCDLIFNNQFFKEMYLQVK